MSSTSAPAALRGTQAPKPEVLAALTDRHFLTVLGSAEEPLSRAEVAARSGLSKPAISTAALRLLDRGLIFEVGLRQGRRGGVATLLRVNAERGHSLALAVQVDAIRVRVSDFVGSVRFEHEISLPPGAARDLVRSRAVAAVRRAAAALPSPLLSAAVSMAEPVDPASGTAVVLKESAFPGGRLDPRRDLGLDVQGPLVVDNDVNWASLAEHQSGVARDLDDFLYVYCGAGLGAGLFLGGRLYRGRTGLAGEIGYLRESSGLDLTQRLSELGLGREKGYGLDVDRARQMFLQERSSPSAREVVDTLARHLGNLVTVLNPSAVVLSGPLAELTDFVDPLSEGIRQIGVDAPPVRVGTFAPLDGASAEAHELALAAVDFPSAVRLS